MTIIQIKEEVKTPYRHVATEQTGRPLSESVRQTLNNYFRQLKGEEPKGVYQMILAEVEVPLLEVVMKHMRNNQTRTAIMLGLSRATVREKLKAYGML